MTAPVVKVRAARLADVDALVALENASFVHDRLSRRAIRAFVKAGHGPVRVATVGGALAGYAVVALREGARVARLYSIAVAAPFARQGVGAALMADVEAFAERHRCDRLRLEVRKTNERALALYRRRGFVAFGEYQAYYQDGADALRFEKTLKAKP